MLITDCDAAADEIEFIISLAMQVDDLDGDSARTIRADIAGRLARLQRGLLEDERLIRTKGDGDGVPAALQQIERTRAALRRMAEWAP
jgi:hypothetical protein